MPPSCSKLCSIYLPIALTKVFAICPQLKNVPWSCAWPLFKLTSYSSSPCSLLRQEWFLTIPWTCLRTIEFDVPSAWRSFTPELLSYSCLHFLYIFVWFCHAWIILLKTATLGISQELVLWASSAGGAG